MSMDDVALLRKWVTDKNAMRPKMWKYTEECKLPTDEEIKFHCRSKGTVQETNA